MTLTLETEAVTYEEAQQALRRVYGKEDSEPTAPSRSRSRPPYAGKFVLEPVPESCGARSATAEARL